MEEVENQLGKVRGHVRPRLSVLSPGTPLRPSPADSFSVYCFSVCRGGPDLSESKTGPHYQYRCVVLTHLLPTKPLSMSNVIQVSPVKRGFQTRNVSDDTRHLSNGVNIPLPPSSLPLSLAVLREGYSVSFWFKPDFEVFRTSHHPPSRQGSGSFGDGYIPPDVPPLVSPLPTPSFVWESRGA